MSAIRVLVFITYMLVVGCVMFEVFTLPWYSAINKSLQQTHHLHKTTQNSCMVLATLIASVSCVVLSSFMYYIFMKNACQEKQVE